MCLIFRNLDYNSRNRCLTLFLTALMVPVDIIKSIYGSLTLLPNLLPIYGPDWINCCLVIVTIGDQRSVANDRIAWMTYMLSSLYNNFRFIFSFDSKSYFCVDIIHLKLLPHLSSIVILVLHTAEIFKAVVPFKQMTLFIILLVLLI